MFTIKNEIVIFEYFFYNKKKTDVSTSGIIQF
jgi:hypothetical protein